MGSREREVDVKERLVWEILQELTIVQESRQYHYSSIIFQKQRTLYTNENVYMSEGTHTFCQNMLVSPWLPDFKNYNFRNLITSSVPMIWLLLVDTFLDTMNPHLLLNMTQHLLIRYYCNLSSELNASYIRIKGFKLCYSTQKLWNNSCHNDFSVK